MILDMSWGYDIGERRLKFGLAVRDKAFIEVFSLHISYKRFEFNIERNAFSRWITFNTIHSFDILQCKYLQTHKYIIKAKKHGSETQDDERAIYDPWLANYAKKRRKPYIFRSLNRCLWVQSWNDKRNHTLAASEGKENELLSVSFTCYV